jgi:SAM-dependent methyltransferase
MDQLEKWWNDCHNTSGSFYVSDYGGPSLWKQLNISDRIIRGKRVLEIGVGDGSDVRELRAKGLEVHVLDITPAALQKVASITQGQWIASRIELLPEAEFDVAISHLVTQHLSNEVLARQIKFVLRSLKPRGVFAMQFADHIEGVKDEFFSEDLSLQQIGAVNRNVRMMQEIVRTAGGKITWLSRPQNFPDQKVRWFNIHIKKNRIDRWRGVYQHMFKSHATIEQ